MRAAFLFFGLAGCYTGSAVDANRGPTTEPSGTEPFVETKEAGAPIATGLPCDVADVLTKSCTGCHGAPPSGGAENRLLSYDDLAPLADAVLARMKSAKRPMPPEGRLASEKVAVIERWIEAGKPRGTCGEATSNEAGAPPPLPPPTSACTSGTTAGTVFGETMKPGKACLGCHSGAKAPAFELAGTVYPSLHEPDDCNGARGVKVLIIDAAGGDFSMTTNEAGNFIRRTSFPRPYRAMIIEGNDVREMKTPQWSGDCNSCHTEWGKDGAPGRVTAP